MTMEKRLYDAEGVSILNTCRYARLLDCVSKLDADTDSFARQIDNVFAFLDSVCQQGNEASEVAIGLVQP